MEKKTHITLADVMFCKDPIILHSYAVEEMTDKFDGSSILNLVWILKNKCVGIDTLALLSEHKDRFVGPVAKEKLKALDVLTELLGE